MSSTEPRYPTTTGPEYINIAEEQVEILKTKYIKMIEVLKEEINKSLKETHENTNKQLEKIMNISKKTQINRRDQQVF